MISAKLGPSSPKRYLILGCGGFIGSHLLDRLLDSENIRVVGWDLNQEKIKHHIEKENFSFHQYDIHDPANSEILREEVLNSDVIVNLAAICNPSQYNTRPIAVIRSNFLDVYKVVEICAEYNKWLIHYSTSEVYGRTTASYLPDNEYKNPELYELDEEITPLIMGPISNQRWSYATAKQLMERYIFAHHDELGLPFTIVRPLNFFGPRMDFIPGREGDGATPRVLACFISALLDKKPLQLVDGGKARRTIVSISDAIEAQMRIFANPSNATNQIFNIGNRDNEVSIAQLAQLIRKTYADISGDPTYYDHPIEVVTSQEFYGKGYEDCDRRMPKTDKANQLLGWKPVKTLEDTVQDTVAYYYDLYGRN